MGVLVQRLVPVSVALSLVMASPAAQATWEERADLIYTSANTLDSGEIEVGLFSPLQYGVTDRFQLSMHPVLLLMLTPHAAMRVRLLPDGAFTASLDMEGTWSLLDKVDQEDRRVLDARACDGCGYPGSLQLSATGSWELTQRLLLSAGLGAVSDFLSFDHQETRIASHASLAWVIDPDNLLLLQAWSDFSPWEASPVGPYSAQITYAHAWGALHLALGLAFGDFQLVLEREAVHTLPGDSGAVAIEDGVVKDLPIFPMIDLWFRL